MNWRRFLTKRHVLWNPRVKMESGRRAYTSWENDYDDDPYDDELYEDLYEEQLALCNALDKFSWSN